MIRLLVEWLASKLPNPRVIYDRAGHSPYLSRYYLFGRPHLPGGGQVFDKTGNPHPDAVWPMGGWGLYLHKFHRGDDDRALHSHPWEWAVSLILCGGYSEERRVPLKGTLTKYRITARIVLPGSVNFIRRTDYHRVDLLRGQTCWSLFLAGPKVDSWSFWDRDTDRTVHWRDFINELRDPTAYARPVTKLDVPSKYGKVGRPS